MNGKTALVVIDTQVGMFETHGTRDTGHLSAAQVVAHHNGVLGGFAGAIPEVVPAAEVRFGEPVGA